MKTLEQLEVELEECEERLAELIIREEQVGSLLQQRIDERKSEEWKLDDIHNKIKKLKGLM